MARGRFVQPAARARKNRGITCYATVFLLLPGLLFIGPDLSCPFHSDDTDSGSHHGHSSHHESVSAPMPHGDHSTDAPSDDGHSHCACECLGACSDRTNPLASSRTIPEPEVAKTPGTRRPTPNSDVYRRSSLYSLPLANAPPSYLTQLNH